MRAVVRGLLHVEFLTTCAPSIWVAGFLRAQRSLRSLWLLTFRIIVLKFDNELHNVTLDNPNSQAMTPAQAAVHNIFLDKPIHRNPCMGQPLSNDC